MLGIFIDSFPPAIDGVSIGQYYTAMELHNRNRELCVVTTKAEGEAYDEPFDVKRLPTIMIPQRKPYGFGIAKFPSSVLSEVKDMDFDLIHAHSPFSVGRLGLRIARNKKIPFIATFHSKFQDDIYEATKSEEITEFAVRKIVEFFCSADELWVADPSIRETLLEYGYYGPVEIVPIGIETAGVEWQSARNTMRDEIGIAPDVPLFLFVGQHIKQKNIDLILDSLALLGDMPYHMVLCGTGNMSDTFEEKAQSLGIMNKVTFAGLVSDRETLMKYYAAADLFLFPSLYDTFGTVIREAAAMHTPSLLVGESTCATFVEENVNAFTADNNPQSYAQRIREIVADRDTLKAVSAHVAKTLGQTWSDVVEHDILPRYDALIEKKRRYHP